MSSEPRLCVIFLDILPPQWIFPPFASSICLLCSSPPLRNRVSQNGCWERSGMRQAACSRTPSLSLSLPLSCLHPPSYMPPPCFLTAPPHPFMFSLLLSFPLIYTHTQTHTSLAWAFHNYCCAIASHVRQKDSPPILLRETNNA